MQMIYMSLQKLQMQQLGIIRTYRQLRIQQRPTNYAAQIMDVWMQDWIDPMARLGVLHLKSISRYILSSLTLFIRRFSGVRGSDWNVECG